MRDSEAPLRKSDRREFIKRLGAGATSAGATMMTALNPSEAVAQPSVPPQASVPASPPWAARGSTKPVSVDVHTHWAPPDFIKAMAEIGKGGAGDPAAADLDRRIKWMDEHGVQTLVLTLNGGMPWQYVSPQTGARLAQIVNDAGIEAHMAHPDRFIVGVELPVRMGDSSAAVKELDRVAGKPGVKGVHLPNSIEARDYLFDPAYDALFARLDQLGYPILFHPMDGAINYYGGTETRVGDPLSESTFLNNSLGFTFETATTAAKFIVSGTLDKFPNLQIVLPHSGGCFPYLAGRVQHGIERRKFPLKHPFRDYIRRFHFDGLAYYPQPLRFLIELVGSDRVMIGTDNAFGAVQPIEYPNAMVEVLKLPAADQDRILRGNAARLFRL